MEHYAHLALAYGLACWLPPFREMREHKRFLWALAANTCDIIDYYILKPMINPGGFIPALLPHSWPWAHRSFTHTIWFAIALALIARAFLPKWHDSLSFLVLELLSHYIPDIFTAKMPLFMPLLPPIGPIKPFNRAINHIGLSIGVLLALVRPSCRLARRAARLT